MSMNEVIWTSNRCFVCMYMCMCFFSNVRICPYIPVAFNFLYERECVSYIFYTCIVCVCEFGWVKILSYFDFKSISKYNGMRMCQIWTGSHTDARTHARTYSNPFNHSVEICVFYPVNFPYAKSITFSLFFIILYIHAPSIIIHLISSLSINPS